MRFDRIWHNARLATLSPSRPGLGVVENGLIATTGGRIAYIGPADEAPVGSDAPERTNCDGRWITPGLIDCHTHLVHGGNRAREFELRLKGATYEEIAPRGRRDYLDRFRHTHGERRRPRRVRAAAARCADRGRCNHRRDQIRLRPFPRARTQDAGGGAQARLAPENRCRHHISRRPCAAAGSGRRQGRLYRAGRPRNDSRARARRIGRCRRCFLRRHRVLAGTGFARVRGGAVSTAFP